MIRRAAVAGKFYPAQPEALLSDIQRYTPPAEKRIAALGVVTPHAGYMYSGPVAGAVYAAVELTPTCIILCPNHFGQGAPLSLYLEGEWETPLGRARVDSELATALRDAFPVLLADPASHFREHSLEVQIPFLQRMIPDFRFVPVCVGVSDYPTLMALGEAIATVLEQRKERTLIVASSDMNHYESDSVTRRKDRHAIDAMLALDAPGLLEALRRHSNTMCGYGPTVAMLTATRRLGANRASLIRYATSGDVSGDRDQVVGYAGLAVWKDAAADQ